MKNNYELITELKEKISIVDVISSYISLSKKGNNFIGVCPFHNDSHPSLTVSNQKNIFKCFACNTSGDVISFVSKIEHIGYIEAMIKLANMSNIDINKYSFLNQELIKVKENNVLYEINNKASEYFQNFLHNKENKKAIDYLNKRQINEELITYFKIGFAPERQDIMIDLLSNKNNILNNINLGYKLGDINDSGLSYINKDGQSLCIFSNRIIIPIYDINNKVVAFGGRTINDDSSKYINTSTTKIFNKSSILFNLNNIINDDINIETIYLVEGYMDVISLHKIGIKNVVATMGVAFSQSHLDSLKILPNLKSIILCFDNDNAGVEASMKTSNILKDKYFISLVNYIDEHKDIDEIISDNKDNAIKQINNVIDLSTFKIKNIIRKYDVNNLNDRRVILSESLKILKEEKDLVSINDNVIKLCEILNIDKELILSQISTTKSNYKKIKNYDSKFQVELEKEISKKPLGFKSTEGTELEILTCIFMNRDCVNIFEEKCNIILNNKNLEIFNIIQDFYYHNQAIDSININDIKEIFKENEELIPIAMKIAINKEKISLKNLQERLEKTIDRHLILIKKEGYKKAISQMKNMNDNDKQELLKKILKK